MTPRRLATTVALVALSAAVAIAVFGSDAADRPTIASNGANATPSSNPDAPNPDPAAVAPSTSSPGAARSAPIGADATRRGADDREHLTDGLTVVVSRRYADDDARRHVDRAPIALLAGRGAARRRSWLGWTQRGVATVPADAIEAARALGSPVVVALALPNPEPVLATVPDELPASVSLLGPPVGDRRQLQLAAPGRLCARALEPGELLDALLPNAATWTVVAERDQRAEIVLRDVGLGTRLAVWTEPLDTPQSSGPPRDAVVFVAGPRRGAQTRRVVLDPRPENRSDGQSLYGRIVRADTGEPVADAILTAEIRGLPFGTDRHELITDGRGAFVLRVDQVIGYASDIWLAVLDDDGNTGTALLPDAGGGVRRDFGVGTVPLGSRTGILVAGTVRGPDGRPLRRASVGVQSRVDGGSWRRVDGTRARTDSEGKFVLRGASASTLRLVVEKRRYALPAPLPFAPGTTGLDVRLVPAAELRVSVAEADADRHLVAWSLRRTDAGHEEHIGSGRDLGDGFHGWDHLVPGTYDVVILWYGKQVFEKTGIAVGPGRNRPADLQDIRLTGPGKSIRIKLLDADGTDSDVDFVTLRDPATNQNWQTLMRPFDLMRAPNLPATLEVAIPRYEPVRFSTAQDEVVVTLRLK